MKKYYVYELVNLDGIVEYVGESTRPNKRFYEHLKHKPHVTNHNGKFYGREDINLNVVAEFETHKEAFEYQCKLQKKYGFKSDAEKNSERCIGRTSPRKNVSLTADTKLKMSEARKRYWENKKQNIA